jgi:hypothetical protein
MFLRLCILLSCILTWSVALISPQWQDLTVLVEPVELAGQILEPEVYIRADPGTNGSDSVINSKPTDNTGLTWNDAVGKGNNIDKLLNVDDLSQCGIAQSNFTKWEALAENGWSKQYQGSPKDDDKNVANWKHAAEKLGWSTDGQKNVQYNFEQVDNVTIDGKIYKGSGVLYSNVMHTDGGIFALQSFSPHNKGASQAPSLDGSPGQELVPLQTWADVSFLEWIDVCKGDDKCVKGLKMITKCHAQSNATMQIASQALGGTENWSAWPGKTFNKDSEQFAALMATPSGRGVAWLLLSHRKQLGWKSVSKINLWSEADHDSKSNYYTFELEDGVPQTKSTRSTGPEESSNVRAVQRHAERDAKNNDSSIVYDSDSVSARYEELFVSDHNYSYDQAQNIGGYLVNLTKLDAEESCVQQSQWKFSDLKSNGWDSTTSKLDDKATLGSLNTIFSDAKLSFDDETPEHTVWEHARSSDISGKTHPATHAKYDALYSKHAIAVLGVSSPASTLQKDEKELLPPLKALSDVLWLQWADWSNAKKNDIKDLRFIVVYQATNSYTTRIVGQIFNNQTPPKYPGKNFESDSKELRALLASPHGQVIVWLLSQHKSELGTKTVKSVQIWNEQQPCILFEISSLDTNDNKKSTSRSEAERRSLFLRADSWEQSVAKGKAFLDMLKCGSGRPSEFTSGTQRGYQR